MGGTADVAAAIRRAWNARHLVRAQSLRDRVAHIRGWADTFRRHRTELIDIAVASGGCNKKWAISQVDGVIGFCAKYDQRASLLDPEPVDGAGSNSALVYEPYGVLGLVTPGNSPYRAVFYALADGLAAGNAVVVRPASAVMEPARFALALVADAWGDAIQLTDAPGAEVADAFTASPEIGVIRVFGGFRTGTSYLKAYAQALAAADSPTSFLGMRRLKTFVLELSGNDPMVILPGSRVDEAVAATVQGSFLNSGQVCLCAKRIIVHREVADAFQEQLARAVGALKIGPADDPDTDVGPLTTPGAFTRVVAQLDDAVQRGGRVLCGGGRRESILEPTIVRFDKEQLLVPVASQPSLWRDECFGPVRGLVVVDDRDEAHQLAADTSCGLGATVFGRDEDCQWLAQRLDAGRVVINRNPAALVGQMLPFGGVKDSGLTGAEHPIRAVTYRKLLVQ